MIDIKLKKPRGVSTILILGVIAVLVTIIIPLISRSVVDVRITKQQEEQARTFSAAEAGLEKALIGGDLEGLIGEDINYQVTTTGRGGGDTFIYPKRLERDSPITVWLVEHEGVDFDAAAAIDFTGDDYQGPLMRLYWGESGTSGSDDSTPAVEMTLFYQEAPGDYKTNKYPYDPNSTRRNDNQFNAPDGSGPYTIGGQEFEFGAERINIPCNIGNVSCYAIRLRLLYNDNSHPVAISGVSDSIPRQGQCYESLATLRTSGITSRVQRCLFYKDFPAVFDFVLFSNYSLEKEVL